MKNLLYLLCFFCFVSCSDDSSRESTIGSGDTGVAGSYARFLTVGDFLYIVDDSSIKTFSTDDAENPELIDEQFIGERIESIFHFAQRLFVGSGAGLFIYQIEADGKPAQLSATNYFSTFETFACDPVVADADHAFVTLNSLERIDSPCGSVEVNVNELRIYDIQDLTEPILLQQYPMQAPKGVGLDGDILFICDDTAGLKIFNVEDVYNIQLIKEFTNFTTYDVITLDGLLLVVGPDNVYQFDYTDLEDIKLVAEIPYGA